ncbi:MAG: hypothetical protein ACRDZQ_07940 [Acidimicrobiales bacterium]
MTIPGLPGDWLNGWLAAIGITVLVEGARLSWSDDLVPIPTCSFDGGDSLPALLSEALPSVADLGKMAIADSRLPTHAATLQHYQQAASTARATADFSLAASVTDLAMKVKGDRVAHSEFDPGVPAGRTLWSRLKRCRLAIEDGHDTHEEIESSLRGHGRRTDVDGLGFDVRRISTNGAKRADPVVECLAFYGLALFPLRGDGRRSATRGWRAYQGVGRPQFAWATWEPTLDRWGVDALLGMVYSAPRAFPGGVGLTGLTGLTGVFEAVPYQPSADKETTRGFASRRLR